MSTTSATSGPAMRRDFEDRDELVAYLRQQFPSASTRDNHISPILGGRREAVRRMQAVDPPRYAKTRNHLDGAVTRLSPFLRHGVLSLPEVRDYALGAVRYRREAEKLVKELAWRDYFQRVYWEIGSGIWKNREDWKTGVDENQREARLPDEIPGASTGLACIDAFAQELHETGYLHNHARMYISSYITHHRRVRWQAGAFWFLQHLLDGDPASNNLSWQWVGSTFSTKAYLFNRENLERNSDGVYCKTCPVRGRCDFEGSYEDLELKLFPAAGQPVPQGARPSRQHERRRPQR